MYNKVLSYSLSLSLVLSVAVFVIRDIYKKADLCLNLYQNIIKYYAILSLFTGKALTASVFFSDTSHMN